MILTATSALSAHSDSALFFFDTQAVVCVRSWSVMSQGLTLTTPEVQVPEYEAYIPSHSYDSYSRSQKVGI